MRLRTICLLVTAVASSTPLSAQRPLNLSFEQASVAYADRPWGWTLGWSAFTAGTSARFTLDSTQRVDGRYGLHVRVDEAADAPTRQITLQISADGLRGRRLRLEGRMRQLMDSGSAAVSLEVWGSQGVATADSLRRRVAVESEWQPLALEITVPSDSSNHSVVILIGAQGRGSAWFDALVLLVDGAPVTTTPEAVPRPSRAELLALAPRATALSAVDAVEGDDAADLRALDQIIGDARIVGLGESTHGTSEFFRFKHRILAHLAARGTFTVFAIEANQFAVQRLDAYVTGGQGAAEDAMRALFRVWYTEEVRDLVEWIRNWNLKHPARLVRFVGYDMQDHRTPVDTLLAFVREREPAMLARTELLTRAYRAQSSFATPQVPDAERLQWMAMADSLASEVAQRRDAWLAAATTAPDSMRAEWAVQSANLFRQAARLNATLNSPDRDSLMAANLDWAVTTLYPGARAVAWAHDVHVSRGGDPIRSFNSGAQMGAYLRQSYGGGYRAIGFGTQRGFYTATRSFTDHEMVAVAAYEAPPGSVEQLLGALSRAPGSPGLLLDLRSPSDPSLQTLQIARPIRHIGYAAYDYGFEMRAIAPLEFDALVFIETTTASRQLKR